MYVEVPVEVERYTVKKVEQIQEEIVHRPITKIVVRDVKRECPVVKKVCWTPGYLSDLHLTQHVQVKKEIQVDRIVEVPKPIEVVRNIVVEGDEQVFEIPKYVENTK